VELNDAFEVDAAPDAVWSLLIDLERVVPLMPGAELGELIDPSTAKGRVHTTLGPVKLTFGGTVQFEELDAAGRCAVMRVKANETRGKGIAQARVTSRVLAVAAGARVEIVTDLHLSGAVAQYGGSLLAGVAKQLTEAFARNVAALLRGAESELSTEPISGLRVVAGMTRDALRSVRGERDS